MTNESGNDVDDKLAAFEHRIELKLSQMTGSVDKLANSVQLLADRDIRSQEREDQQRSFNTRIGTHVDKISQDLAVIQLARAEEKHAVDAVKRAQPWIVVLGIMGPALATAIGMAWIKGTVETSGPQRAVVPLVQSYYPPQHAPQQIESAPAPRQ